MPQPNDGKNQLDSHAQNFMLNLLSRKFIDKIKYSTRRVIDPDFLGVTISSHVIYSRFLSFPGTLGQLRKTKIGCSEAEELPVTGEKIFHYLKKKDF